MGADSVETMTNDVDFGVSNFFIGIPGVSVATGEQDSASIFALGMPKGLNKAEPFVHSVVVYDGTAGNDSLLVTSTGISGIQVSGDISRNYTNVVLFEFHGHNGNDNFNGQYASVPINAFGGNGNDTLKGSSFYDRLVGGAGHDMLFAYGGNDVLEGGSGEDLLNGGSGNDKLYGYKASSAISDGVRDFLVGGSGYDQAWGDSADWLFSIESFTNL